MGTGRGVGRGVTDSVDEWLLDEAAGVGSATDVSAVTECTMDGRRPVTGRVAMSETVELRLVAGGEGMSD